MAGDTDMEVRTAGVTAISVLPVIPPEVAMIVAFPVEAPVASPPAFTVATGILDELQVTCAVISGFVPSEYVPTAANCWVVPAGTLGLAGNTDMAFRVTAVTVREMFFVKPPKAAVIVAFPAATPVARPLLPTVATDILDELQVTCVVIS